MSQKRQIKLGLIPMGAGGPGTYDLWRDPEIPGDASVNIDWYLEVVRAAEAAKFDLVFIVDSQFITPHSPPHYLNRLEPLTLLSALSTATSHIGLVGTATTSFNSPFNLVRRFASLDLISRGRAGWNVVTSGDPGAAGNFGLDEHYDYDTRYGRAHEYVGLARALWDSYEDDAFPRDKESGQFLDPSRQHALHHTGDYFSVAGPLNIERSPQGQPVIFQAGDSDQGRDLGAATAEGIFTHAADLAGARAFYADISRRAVAAGRDPEDIVIMPGIRVVVADSDEEAQELERHNREQDHGFDHALSDLSRGFGWHDFRRHDLDAPFPAEALQSAERSFFTQAQRVTQHAQDHDLTLRQVVEERRRSTITGPFVGSAETVADRLGEWFTERGCDGYNIHLDHPAIFRRFTGEVLPILQERGLYRTEYEATTLRGNLGLPIPANRHTTARSAESEQRGA
jgi:FMN-dependent oxidoreductase (nitrilotriacetate monooxygenase family)